MRIRVANIGVLCLALALIISASLVAAGARTTNAYFSDTKCGTIGGTVRVPDPDPTPAPTSPYRLEAGASKALHEAQGNDHSGKEPAIAQRDASGALRLDFGDAPAGRGDTRPDVFRIVSLVDDPRAVSFRTSGAMADFITEVCLANGQTAVLGGHATERVRVTIRVPDGAAPGVYAGTLTVHVQGWADDAQLPMTFTVTGDAGKGGKNAPANVAVPSVELSDLTDTQPESSQTTTETATPDPAQDPTPSEPTTVTPEPTSTPDPIDEEGTHDDGY